MTEEKTNVPANFYKYRPMNTPAMISRVEQIVLGNEVFFAPPSFFDDPFDLKPAFSLDAPPEVRREDYLRLSKKYQPHYSEAQHIAEADAVLATSLDAENVRVTTSIMQAMHAQALASVGVFCVSTKRDDILMWSHYADSHKGVCLEFDGMSPLMAHAQRVNYSHKRVPINPYTDSRMEMMEKAMLTKADHWAYEAEWRLFSYERGPGLVQFRPMNLTGIILGAIAPPTTIKTVKEWVSKRSHPLAIYRAAISHKEFEILVEPFPDA